MKTGEMYAMTLKKPLAKFIRESNGGLYFLNESGELCNVNRGYALHVKSNENWEMARELVDFMTAFNSNEVISSEDDAIQLCSAEWILQNCILTLEQINGKWYIENKEEE
jgi:hypothetical protein